VVLNKAPARAEVCYEDPGANSDARAKMTLASAGNVLFGGSSVVASSHGRRYCFMNVGW